jgi:cbb3-type cytochrome oxidase maturation protein
MSVLVGLIAAGGMVAVGFLIAFVWAVRTGQFDDTVSPALRILFDDVVPVPRAPGDSHRSRHTGDSHRHQGNLQLSRFESAADVHHRS